MSTVFVHGVPETHIIWDPIRSRLSRKDVVAVDMPGFGAPVPALRRHERSLRRLARRRDREDRRAG